MDEYKLCSDGLFLPVNVPCPPPYSGPYYSSNPYENLPLPPEEGINTDYSASSSKGGGASISSGAVAGIIITGGLVFFVLCLVALKCRARFILGYGRNARNHDQLAGDQLLVSSGDNMVIVGCGLEERLVNLLPVYEYVGLMQEGKVDGQERQECAVCLSLFEEKETVRVLPKCHHVFHTHCIDKWFESHTNCPLCRERITLQAIQLSLIYSNKPDHDQQPLHPALTPPQNHAHDHDQYDQHGNSSSSRVFCVHVDHQRLAGDLQHPHSHQNLSFALPSAALHINNPHTTKYADRPGATHAACGHLAADDQNSAGFTDHRVRGHCDHKNPSIPAMNPAESLRDAESQQDKNAFKEPARDASAPLLYSNDDAQSAGAPPSAACSLQSFYKHFNPSAARDRSRSAGAASAHQAHQHEADDRACQGQKESSKTGEFFHPMLQARAGDHKTAPANFHLEQQPSHHFDRALVMINSNTRASTSTRQFSLLRKSLSTGSMDVESNGKASTLPLHAPARLARSSTRLYLL